MAWGGAEWGLQRRKEKQEGGNFSRAGFRAMKQMVL